jgi:peptidoglycan hydrolase CwlO-like protein
MNLKKITLGILAVVFLFADIGIYKNPARAAEDAGDIQDKLDKYQNQLEDTQKQLQTSQTQLSKNQVQLNMTKNILTQTEQDIARKEAEITDLEHRIELSKVMLASYVQEMYISDSQPVVSFLASDQNIDESTENFDQMMGVKDKINSTLDDINQTKSELEDARADLADKKDDHEKLLSVQQGQQYEIKSNIVEAQATLSELNAKIDKLRGELSSLLGSSVSFKNVMDAASFAAKVTGIRKDYLLGVLVVESNLGRFTGGCNFKQSRMSGTRATIFKSICSDLKYDYNKQKVSCPPSGYKGTGGAMGVAQFMPDTWQGYKSRIASVTGHSTPDPWSLTDGVVAMALKLTQVSGVTAHKESAEAKAYCIYLAGGNWAAYCDSKGVDYGAKVLYWADNYEKVMN